MKTFRPDEALKRFEPLLRKIGKKVLAIRRSGNFSVQRKSHYSDIVTRGDKLSEKMIVDYITKYYPGHRMRGEEGTDVRSGSLYEWIIDPIDGTTNYQKGNDLFGISVGVYKNGAGVLGIIYFPALGKMVWAVRGRGAFVNGKRVRIKNNNEGLKDALISAGLCDGTEYLFPLLCEKTMNVLAGGSCTGESLWLLTGQIDAFVHTGATPYDLAAARIIVEEAGGVASGIASKMINLNDKKIPIILAQSERLVRELRELLNKN